MVDTEFIRKLKQKDEAAWELLVSRYQQRLYRSLFFLLRDHDDTCDMVNEAMLKAFENIGSFGGRSEPYTWVYRIAYNLCLGCLRKRKMVSFVTSLLAPGTAGFGADEPHSNGVEAAVIMNERQKQLLKLIDRLPPKMRAVVILRHCDDLSYEEIADAVGCNVGTVRSRLFNARDLLAGQMEDWS